MMAATGPNLASLTHQHVSTSDAKRIVPIVMPETGLFDEPTRPAMYADTELNRKPATIMMIVIGNETPKFCTIAWYSRQRQREQHQPDEHQLHGQVALGFSMTLAAPARVAARPLRMPDISDVRSEISVQTPPINIAPTPR